MPVERTKVRGSPHRAVPWLPAVEVGRCKRDRAWRAKVARRKKAGPKTKSEAGYSSTMPAASPTAETRALPEQATQNSGRREEQGRSWRPCLASCNMGEDESEHLPEARRLLRVQQADGDESTEASGGEGGETEHHGSGEKARRGRPEVTLRGVWGLRHRESPF